MDASAIFAYITADYIILLVGFAILFGLSMYGDRSGGVAVVFAVPTALFLRELAGGAAVIGTTIESFGNTDVKEVIILVALAAVALVVISHLSGQGFETSTSAFQGATSAAAGLIMLLVVWHITPSVASLWDFNAQISSLFAAQYLFWWSLAAFVLLLLPRRGW